MLEPSKVTHDQLDRAYALHDEVWIHLCGDVRVNVETGLIIPRRTGFKTRTQEQQGQIEKVGPEVDAEQVRCGDWAWFRKFDETTGREVKYIRVDREEYAIVPQSNILMTGAVEKPAEPSLVPILGVGE